MITSSMEPKESNKSKYPYIGILDNTDGITVVLFTSKGCGVCLLTTASSNTVGEYYDSWAERVFTTFFGEITLKND